MRNGKRGARTTLAERIIDKLDSAEAEQVAKDAGHVTEDESPMARAMFAKGFLYRNQYAAEVRKALLKLCVEKLS